MINFKFLTIHTVISEGTSQRSAVHAYAASSFVSVKAAFRTECELSPLMSRAMAHFATVTYASPPATSRHRRQSSCQRNYDFSFLPKAF